MLTTTGKKRTQSITSVLIDVAHHTCVFVFVVGSR